MSEIEMTPFFKIRINSIHASKPVPFDIFVLINGRQVHYLRAGDSLTAEKIEKFQNNAPNAFYINTAHRQTYKDYIQSRLDSPDVNTQEKALILKESSYSLVEEIFESPDVEKALEQSKGTIQNFMNFMDADPSAMANLIGLSSHDFYTYQHSLDVSIYSLGLGQLVGYSGEELQELGRGSLFHDIGKRKVDVSIICKKGPLDDIEWAQMRKHPQYGLEILNDYDVSQAIKACCFEHHESALGNGYPQQLEGHEIHPMARIIALSDTYDALTTQRSYNKPMSPHEALTFMKEKLSGKYDKDLLKAMYSVLFKMEESVKKTG